LMAAPNLIALAVLSPIIFKATKEYFDKLEAKSGEAGGDKAE
jgi:alanine or glycine:cation symporter, AGCS family